MKRVADYRIRDLPGDLHRAFRVLCVEEGVSMRTKLLELMGAAVESRRAIKASGAPNTRSPRK